MDALFYEVPKVVNASGTSVTNTGATPLLVPASQVYLLPGEAGEGLTFRFRLAGSKTGTNAVWTLTLVLSGTAIFTLACDGTAAVDWVADLTCRFNNGASQRTMGTIQQLTEDSSAGYEAGTVNVTGGGVLGVYLTTHSSDVITIDLITVERWVK
jgi:hypothetical protein